MVKAELRPDTILVSLMMVNNEIGTVLMLPQLVN
jgi:cysteine sulfinate desulfinase/cysteine desulfurase-like protein